jgi:REP element-mobilizing transposase RayT
MSGHLPYRGIYAACISRHQRRVTFRIAAFMPLVLADINVGLLSVSRHLCRLCWPTLMSGYLPHRDFYTAHHTTMSDTTNFYRRNLPHIHPANAEYFITFRLQDTLPRAILEQLLDERHREEQKINTLISPARQEGERYRIQKKQFGLYDSWLDRCIHGPRWLEEEKIAAIVAEEICRLDRDRYRLLAFCIMPNHVHLLIDTHGFFQTSTSNQAGATRNYPLADVLRLLKGRTSRYCNLALGRSGAFWHQESYDHVVRDAHELENIIRYILNNPVKAGLVEEWHKWKFSYVAEDLGDW